MGMIEIPFHCTRASQEVHRGPSLRRQRPWLARCGAVGFFRGAIGCGGTERRSRPRDILRRKGGSPLHGGGRVGRRRTALPYPPPRPVGNHTRDVLCASIIQTKQHNCPSFPFPLPARTSPPPSQFLCPPPSPRSPCGPGAPPAKRNSKRTRDGRGCVPSDGGGGGGAGRLTPWFAIGTLLLWGILCGELGGMAGSLLDHHRRATRPPWARCGEVLGGGEPRRRAPRLPCRRPLSRGGGRRTGKGNPSLGSPPSTCMLPYFVLSAPPRRCLFPPSPWLANCLSPPLGPGSKGGGAYIRAHSRPLYQPWGGPIPRIKVRGRAGPLLRALRSVWRAIRPAIAPSSPPSAISHAHSSTLSPTEGQVKVLIRTHSLPPPATLIIARHLCALPRAHYCSHY